MLATLKLTIRRFPDSSHIVDAELTSDASAAPSQLASNVPVAFDEAALLAVESDPAAYGRALSAQLFADPRLRNGWLKARAFAATGDLQLRLNLDAGDAALHDLHWERLRDPETDQPVALYERVRLVRTLESADLTPVVIPPRPNLHALVVVSNPSNLGDFGLAEVDVEGEIARTRAALGDIPAAILGEHAEASGRATLMNITAALRDAPPIVILVAHGTIRDGTPYVWLEQDDGTPDRVTGDTIAETLRRLSVRSLLLVLASCRSAGGGYGDTFKALGPQLAGVGVPAVLAFHGDVAMSTVKVLLPTLVTELRRDGQIDRALAAARAALGEQRPWWQAVLWVRTDGRLWHEQQNISQFSIEGVHLGEPLLREIALLSLEQHKLAFGMNNRYGTPEITRRVHDDVLDVVGRTHKRLIFLRGASGTGKSTLLRQLGQQINKQGGLALWVPVDEIAVGTPLNTLLLKVLRRFHPSVNSRAGDDALQLAKDVPGGIVLLIDDVNRAVSPYQALVAIQALDTKLNTNTNSTHSLEQIRMIVPLWPNQLIPGTEPAQSNAHWEEIILEPFSDSERQLLALNSSSTNSSKVLRVIDALNGDPFLCGIAPLNEVPLSVRRSDLIKNVFEIAIREIFVIAQTVQAGTIAHDFETAINQLISFILQNNTPEPAWNQVQLVVSRRTTELLATLARTNQLGWIDSHNEQPVWKWKHTRLRDALFGRWLAKNLLIHLLSTPISLEIVELLENPGLAEALALATVFISPRQQLEIIEVLANYQVLILAEVLRLGLFPSETKIRNAISSRLRNSLQGFNEKTAVFVTDPRLLILEKLTRTDDTIVLQIIEGLARGRATWAACVRNGDLGAALEWISKEQEFYGFLPSIRFSFFEQAIRGCISIYSEQRISAIFFFSQSASRIEDVYAVLTMASYFGWPELIEPLWNVWIGLPAPIQLETLLPIAWLLSQSEGPNIRSKLEVVFLKTLELSDEQQEKGLSSERYNRFLEPLEHACWRPMSITATIAEIWAEIIESHADLAESMAYILGCIDHPTTLEAYARWHVLKENRWSYWDESGETLDPLAEPDYRSSVPKTASVRNHLWKVIQREVNQPLRKRLWYLWRRAANRSELPALQSMPIDDPLYEDVLRLRIKLRDDTAARLLIERIRISPQKWCGYTPLLARAPGVFDAFLENIDAALESRTFDIGYSDWVIAHLPVDKVQVIIRGKRDLLLKYPRTWPSLWHSNVPEALLLLQSALSEAHQEDLKYFFFTRWPKHISSLMLDTLTPVLDRFPESEREHLAELALRHGFREWVVEHLPHVLDTNRRKLSWATPEGVMATLDEVAAVVPRGAAHLHRETNLFGLEIELTERAQSLPSISTILQTWLDRSADRDKMIVAAILLAQFGLPSDVNWWQYYSPNLDDEIAYEAWLHTLYALKRRLWHGPEKAD